MRACTGRLKMVVPMCMVVFKAVQPLLELLLVYGGLAVTLYHLPVVIAFVQTVCHAMTQLCRGQHDDSRAT